MKVRFYVILTLLAGIFTASAQDQHFSMFYASPLTLNPALTGDFNGLYRISGIYRNQWSTLNDNGKAVYSTPCIGADMSLLRDKLKDMGSFGVGLLFLNDEQAGQTITDNEILASVAYNMLFGPKKRFQLGVGLQGGVLMTKLDPSSLQFDQGFYVDANNNVSYNSALSTESLQTGQKTKGLFNAGIFAKYEFVKGMTAYIGYAFDNATHYSQKYVLDDVGSMTYYAPFRNTLHGGLELEYHDKLVFIPGFMFQHTSAGDAETDFGLTIGLHVIKSPDPMKRATVFFGLWDRVNNQDALIPKLGFEYKGFRAGFAYDIAMMQQRIDAAAVGGGFAQSFEISLVYTGDIRIPKEDHYLFNPRY